MNSVLIHDPVSKGETEMSIQLSGCQAEYSYCSNPTTVAPWKGSFISSKANDFTSYSIFKQSDCNV
jgi:hypothetical protein